MSNYYVSPAGSDSGAGTSSAPWATLQHAADVAVAGDTVIARAGNYAGFVMSWDTPKAGTATAPITFMADPAATPGSVVINARNPKTYVGIDLEPGSDYITISGFAIQGAGSGGIATYPNRGSGIKVTGNHDVVSNTTVANIDYGFGIIADNANNVVLRNNTITGTGYHNNGNYGHGIYLSGSTDGAIVQGNVIHDNTYVGIHINGDISEGGNGLVTHALIEGNVIYNNGQNAINADGIQSSVIRNNLIYGYQNFGIVFYKIDAAAGSSNNIIANNTIASPASSAGAAVRLLNGATGNTLFNNILLGGGGVTLRVSNDSLPGLVSDYNVASSLYQSEDSSATQTLAQWRTQTGQDSHSILATATQLFANSAGSDFHLSATSPAINVGTGVQAPLTDLDGKARPSGSGFDIGAYEYQTGSTLPIVTSQTPLPNATSVLATTSVTATFNVSIQPSTLSFVLKGPNSTVVSASVVYNDTTHTATLTPSAALAANTTYTATASGAKDSAGNAMPSAFSWSFTTIVPQVTSSSPGPGAVGVATSPAITATFNEAIQSNTLSFVLRDPNQATIAAGVSYNATTHVATLTPSSALAANTVYTVTVSGVKDTAGNSMAAPFSWTFTTLGSGPYSMWSNSVTPSVASDSDTNQVELGVEFHSDLAGTISGIKFYKGSANTGTHVGHLWSSTGQLLGTATFTNETVTGWQQVNFATPISIAANTTYMASYYAPVGGYAADSGYFASSFDNGVLHAPADAGQYLYASGGGFPTATYGSTNYWVDVVFSPTGTSTPSAPTVTTATPASGASSVALTTAETVTFSTSIQASSLSFVLTGPGSTVVPASVSYNDTTHIATLTPTSALAAGTTYTATVSGAKNSSGTAMTTPYTWSFTTDVAPTVNSTTPASATSGVALNAVETATFSKSIQAGTLSFVLTGPGNAVVPASVSYNDTTHIATLTPTSALAAGTTYSATVSGAKDALGTPMSAPYVWSFTTDLAPTVTSVSPASGASGVSLTSTVTATFSTSIQAASLAFVLTAPGNVAVPATVSYNDTTHTAALTPTSALAAKTTYSVTISGIKDALGTLIAAPYVWSFTTDQAPAVTSVSPGAGTTGVLLSAAPSATFSASIQAASLTFVLTGPNSTVVPATVSYNDTTHTATLTPTSTLAAGTTYSATVSGAKDALGTSMAAPYAWSFTTAVVTVNTWRQITGADFAGGTHTGTAVLDIGDGEVDLAPAKSDGFAGSTLGSYWSTSNWSKAGSVSVSSGVASLAGAQIVGTASSSAVEARLSFGSAANQHFGLATGLVSVGNNSWAIFSTGSTTGTLYARVNLSGKTQEVNLGALPSGFHTYKIQPTTTGVRFYVDGTLKATVATVFPTSTALRPTLSAYSTNTSTALRADWFRVDNFATSGTYQSSTFDAGKTATWGLASWTATVPAGTTLVVQTSSSSDGTTWSGWSAVANGGAITSPSARYLRYRVLMTTSDSSVSPTLSDIALNWS